MDTLIATEKMVPLAPFTTLDLGGDAHHMIRIKSYQDAVDAVGWWKSQSQPMPLLALGGGSNLLISDAGFRGLVVKKPSKRQAKQWIANELDKKKRAVGGIAAPKTGRRPSLGGLKLKTRQIPVPE